MHRPEHLRKRRRSTGHAPYRPGRPPARAPTPERGRETASHRSWRGTMPGSSRVASGAGIPSDASFLEYVGRHVHYPLHPVPPSARLACKALETLSRPLQYTLSQVTCMTPPAVGPQKTRRSGNTIPRYVNHGLDVHQNVRGYALRRCASTARTSTQKGAHLRLCR